MHVQLHRDADGDRDLELVEQLDPFDDLLGTALERVLGPQGHVSTSQSLGGEDFGWYLDRAPGAMARLGTRTPGGPTYDLHQGNLRIDEAATGIGARVLAEAAVTALSAR